MDVRKFYLNTPLDRFEYLRLHPGIIPEGIFEAYNLQALATDGWVYIEIQKGVYGLPQAGILAKTFLTKRLGIDGYYPCQFMPGLWWNVWQPVNFVLVVYGFGIKYKVLEHANHVMG